LNCKEVGLLLHAYIDEELDLTQSLQFEGHIKTCGNCSKVLEGFHVLKLKLENETLYYKTPEDFENRLMASLHKKGHSTRGFQNFSQWKAVAATAAIFVMIFLALMPRIYKTSQKNILTQDVLSSHVRSLMGAHMMDVVSTDQHTVKPWFNGKLDFSPPVTDYKDQGFSLAGGRLDYLGGRAVAALIYERRKHKINVYVWPSNGKSEAAGNSTEQGYNIFHWTKSEMNYWVVSDLNRSELQEFNKLLQGK